MHRLAGGVGGHIDIKHDPFSARERHGVLRVVEIIAEGGGAVGVLRRLLRRGIQRIQVARQPRRVGRHQHAYRRILGVQGAVIRDQLPAAAVARRLGAASVVIGEIALLHPGAV